MNTETAYKYEVEVEDSDYEDYDYEDYDDDELFAERNEKLTLIEDRLTLLEAQVAIMEQRQLERLKEGLLDDKA